PVHRPAEVDDVLIDGHSPPQVEPFNRNEKKIPPLNSPPAATINQALRWVIVMLISSRDPPRLVHRGVS
ncbi:MAG TPA: hypothetical protein VLY45_05870, partial [Nitrospiria bacterium]|nr:hypothetical protein [Nitrospiria bacterium]